MDRKAKSIVLDFGEKHVSRIAFARTREEADRIKKELNMITYFPSEIANFGDDIPMYVLIGE